MRKLEQLTDFLVNKELFAAENLESFVDEPLIIPAGNFARNGTQSALCIYEQNYTAAFYIERYPFKIYPPEILFSHIALWLMEHDPLRDGLEDMQTDVAVNDYETADIELLINFREPVFALEDVSGSYSYRGKNYRLANPDIEGENFERGYVLNLS